MKRHPILLCGIPSEPPLERVIEAAEDRGIEYALFSQREARWDDICLDLCDGTATGTLSLCGRDWPLELFSGVYTRMTTVDSLPEYSPSARPWPDASELERVASLHDIFNVWLEIAGCRVCNRPTASASNVSKPFQAQTILQCGLLTPPTLITNDPAEVRAFRAEHGRIVYKSISSIRSIVQEFGDTEETSLPRIRLLVTQFQAYIPGTNIRVHVVGDDVFATEICSETVDYRYAPQDGMTMQAVSLPDDIAVKCIALSRRLGLPLCGIDLKRTPDGAWYCFEANPSPAYSCFQDVTGQPIAEAIVMYLSGGSA